MKKIFFAVAVFFLTLCVAVVVIELTKTPKQAASQYFRTRKVFQYQKENTVFDAATGYTIAPNLNTTFNNIEFNTTVTTNQFGFRDDDASLNNPDVLFLGDSYIWGWGVNENESVEKLYEKQTGKKVLNMATPGYGNIQELLTLYKWERRGPLENKEVLLFFCANDLSDNENTSFAAFPYFKLINNNIGLQNPSKTGYDEWLEAVNKWTIDNKIAARYLSAYYVLAAIKNMRTNDIYRDYQTDENKMNGAQAFIYVAENLAQIAKQTKCRITIVYIPSASYYKNGNADKSYTLVKDVCQKLQIRFADLTNILSAADYYPLDMHWKPSGHLHTADFISKL